MAVSVPLSRRAVLSAGAALTLAACGPGKSPAKPASGPKPGATADTPPAVGSLEWAVAGPWREANAKRDPWRHPLQTLTFFGLKPGMTVIELWPGAGWYSEIVAPFLNQTKGMLYAASFESQPGDVAAAEVVANYRKMIEAKPDLYGSVAFGTFGPKSGPLAPPASADLVLFIDSLQSWMAAGLVEKAFRDAFAALRPGGALGIEAHRGEPGPPQDPLAADGYVQQAYVKQLAAEAGFRFDTASEINANPKDTRKHPFGVWTLPPERRSAPAGQPANPAFDHKPYDAIGESDRMTLRFVKPA